MDENSLINLGIFVSKYNEYDLIGIIGPNQISELDKILSLQNQRNDVSRDSQAKLEFRNKTTNQIITLFISEVDVTETKQQNK